MSAWVCPTVVGTLWSETVLDIPQWDWNKEKLMASVDALRTVLDGIEL